MDLSRIEVEARVRRPWEAIDLGFVVARQWWKPLFLSWVIPSFTLYCILGILFYQRAWVAPLVIWWLKPFWDRGPLYVASRALFGERLAVRQVLHALPGMYKTDWLAWLCWRRFSVNRSYVMPVTVLENLHGRARRSRLAVLRSQNASAAHWLTAVCTHLEGLTLFGTIGLIIVMLPPEGQFDTMELMLAEEGVINDVQGGQEIVVFHSDGTSSALGAGVIAEAADVGATGVFSPIVDGQTLTFSKQGDEIVDEQTGSIWNVLGQAIEGPLAGAALEPIVHGDHFWFSWAAFKPDTIIYSGE